MPLNNECWAFNDETVAHTTEIAYVYGTTSDPSPLSKNIMDYWLSFATSLTPNDGKGSHRKPHPYMQLQSSYNASRSRVATVHTTQSGDERESTHRIHKTHAIYIRSSLTLTALT